MCIGFFSKEKTPFGKSQHCSLVQFLPELFTLNSSLKTLYVSESTRRCRRSAICPNIDGISNIGAKGDLI